MDPEIASCTRGSVQISCARWCKMLQETSSHYCLFQACWFEFRSIKHFTLCILASLKVVTINELLEPALTFHHDIVKSKASNGVGTVSLKVPNVVLWVNNSHFINLIRTIF
jgi:hypothetical protein